MTATIHSTKREWHGDTYHRGLTVLGTVEELERTPVPPHHDWLDEPLWLAKAAQYAQRFWTRDEAVSFVEQWSYTT